jgi:hypothetical protein
LCGDALAAAGKAKPVSRRRLDADAGGRNVEDGGDPRDHRCTMGADLGPLADDRHIDSGDYTPSLANEIGGASKKLVGGGTTPARIARWEVHADIAGADGSKHRVGQGVEPDISIGMTGKARFVRDLDAANADLIAGCESVHVKALTDANLSLSCRDQPLGRGDIFSRCHLYIVFAAADHERRKPSSLADRGVVGQVTANGSAVRSEDCGEMEALRGLRPPQSGAGDRPFDEPAFDLFDRVAERQARNRRRCPAEPIDDPVDQSRIGKRPRSVVDYHLFRAIDH